MRFFINIIVALISVGVSLPVYAEKAPVALELNASEKLQPYADIVFEYPAYALLALQNIGVPISLSRPLKILSSQSIQIGSEKLTYVKKSGKVYFYTASVGLTLGKEISVPVEIDTTNLANGAIQIRVYPPLSGLMPQEIIVKIESKLQALANPNVQNQLFSYLSENLHGGSMNSPAVVSRLFESISFDAYNQMGYSNRSVNSQSMREVGGSEALSDQASLIAAVLIWLVGLPIFLFVVRKRRAQHPCA